jgi:hypothetical protein
MMKNGNEGTGCQCGGEGVDLVDLVDGVDLVDLVDGMDTPVSYGLDFVH